jgi:hypothetical protein
MTTTNDRDFVKKFQQSEIAPSAYEAAGKAFTDGIIGNPDAALALPFPKKLEAPRSL